MGKHSMGWTTLALAFAFGLPTLVTISDASAKTVKSAETANEAASGSDTARSKEEQAKLKDHNKLRAEIARVTYPAAKSEVVGHLKGVKADDKKWFAETLPDRVYGSADDVMTALGWETAPIAGKSDKTSK